MKSDVSREAATTLSTIDAALRRSEDLHWSDPAFREWERGQVGELDEQEIEAAGETKRVYQAEPGPAHPRYDQNDIGVVEAPMITRRWDHPPSCLCDEGVVPPGGAMVVRAADYPPPEDATHGPLLLGPHPARVALVACDPCGGTGEVGWLDLRGGAHCDVCGACDGTGGRLTEQPSEQPGGAR
ncbi:hypothetical protein F4561_002634 [Lipingzhangella halophila]|uniref:Uncharacterized protein n=1 Tax=Lipingzhangella halophila TaxID=1783352 RepID=A0A7W7W3H5_9ACTN|nr:hypothetical protein [Lipingzhangella halophila]MBB4931814.1 hypothetical protein [Lipingzhangella halophila]